MPIFNTQSSPTQLISYRDLDLNLPPPEWSATQSTLVWEADTRLRRLESVVATGIPGPPGPEGPAGPAGPAGTNWTYVGSNVTTADVTNIATGGWSSPICQMEINGNGTQRYRIIIEGNFWRNTTDAPGLAYAGIFKSSNPGTAFITPTLDGVSPEDGTSFFLEATDVPAGALSYWLLVSTSSNFLTVTAGTRMMIWQTG